MGFTEDVNLFLLVGTESVICQSYANGGGGEVAAKWRCNCFQVFSSDI